MGSGAIAERAVDWDGYTGVIPRTSATLPKALGDYGYNRGIRQVAQHACNRDGGIDLGSPVLLDYFDRRPFKFDGRIGAVNVQLQ